MYLLVEWMREHFQQSEHFTNFPPNVDLSCLEVSTNHGRNPSPGTDLPYGALSSSFPTCKMDLPLWVSVSPL